MQFGVVAQGDLSWPEHGGARSLLPGAWEARLESG